MRKVLHGVSPQPEPVSLNDGNIQNTGQRAGHLSSLRRDLRFSASRINLAVSLGGEHAWILQGPDQPRKWAHLRCFRWSGPSSTESTSTPGITRNVAAAIFSMPFR